jgi:hypothetical protein
VTEAGGRPSPPPPDLLAALSRLESDATGAETFARYMWQAKHATRLWLTCLREIGPAFVVVESVEDVVLVYQESYRFIQLKTRDAGSWSAAVMCDRGIDTLVRSYKAARATGLHEVSTFELWLEGPASDARATTMFVSDPSTATESLRRKLRQLSLRADWIDDFLQRLRIRPGITTRSDIDAKAVWEMGALWPALPRSELELIFQRLLVAVTAAQEAAPASGPIQGFLAAAKSYIDHHEPEPVNQSGPEVDSFRNHVLSREMLAALTPPGPDATVDDLLARMSDGSGTSLLELKMTRGGAAKDQIVDMLGCRADMEVDRQLLLASRTTAEADLEQLATRVLSLAKATATSLALSAASNPAAASRPAATIAADLSSRPADLAAADRQMVFDRDPHLLYGFLGHLSDLCRFSWRSS